MAKKICKIDEFVGNTVDPYSKKGKEKLNKNNCYATSIATHEGTIFFIGDNYSKEVNLVKGYFNIEKEFDEKKNMWNSTFSKVKKFDEDRILITDGSGPKQNGILMSADKGRLVSRTLDEIKMMKDM